MPDHLVALALLDDLDRLELQTLGIRVDRVDDAAASRGMGADIEMVGGGDREADQVVAVEYRHENATSGPCDAPPYGSLCMITSPGRISRRGRRAASGCRAHSPGSGPTAAACSSCIRKLAAFGVGQRRAEILELADDAGIAHAHQLVAHLDGDVLERALDDRAGDGVDASIRGDGWR